VVRRNVAEAVTLPECAVGRLTPSATFSLAINCIYEHNTIMAVETEDQSYLRRLEAENYRNLAIVHWTHAMKDRKKGWLTAEFHQRFRELLLHAGGKYAAWCPAYCLMPDHFHLIWMGISEGTDQKLATQWLRREVNRELRQADAILQRQAYDRILRNSERDQFAFEKLIGYVMDNPLRAGLVEESADWPFRGSILPGYPSVFRSAGDEDYWERFWKVYYSVIRQT